MLVANSFDLWQKDAFFSAAEEVQASADIMESSYRTWVRQRREGMTPQILDELSREVQTALGTAKWQLDEFESAISLSYRNRVDDITMTRHGQFVAAIENQITCVEAALSESFNEQGKQPLRWVNLDKEERDDLAMFLSGAPGTSKSMKDDCTKFGAQTKISLSDKQYTKKALDALKREIPNHTKDYKDFTSSIDANYVIEVEPNEVPGTSDDSSCQADRKAGTRRTWSSPDIGALKIIVDDGDEQKKALMLPKEKGSKASFWKPMLGDLPQAKGAPLRGPNWINQLYRRAGGSQRQQQTSINFQRSRSVQLTLILMLTIFLIVPFFYSN